MTDTKHESDSSKFGTLITFILVVGGLVILTALFIIQRERSLQESAKKWAIAEFGLSSPTTNRLHEQYTDANGDLVADVPEADSDHLQIDELRFSYIAGANSELWQPLMEAIGEATGLPVSYIVFETLDQQLAALRDGQVHIVGFNTGSVPRAVNAGGFVPLFTLSGGDGSVGITTKIIVPEGSDVSQIADIKQKRITFTSPNSNSGFKAPLVILQEDFGMSPDKEYGWGFSTSHDESIRLVSEGADDTIIAPVASDMLDRAIAKGEIREDQYRIIYESETFPAAAIGLPHNLTPELRDKIQRTMASFEFAGTTLGAEFGENAKFVPISYKDDFALIRRIDNAMGNEHDIDESGDVTDAESDESTADAAADQSPADSDATAPAASD